MAPLDDQKGVWKSGKGKGRQTPKGRQSDETLAEIQALIGERRRRDLLIEYLHLIQDKHGLSAEHMPALAIMRMLRPKCSEVATFYAHFDVVKEGEARAARV